MRGEPRVIPRPSERRRTVQHPAASIDLRDHRQGPPTSSVSANIDQVRSGFSTTFRTLGVVGALSAAIAFGLLGLTGRADTTFGMIVAPVLATLAMLGINKWIRPRLGPEVAAVFVAGYGLRLAGAVPRLLGGADATIYQREGMRIAQELKAFNFGVESGRNVPGTGTIRYLTGVVNVFTGSSYITTFLLFASIAFVGQCFFLLAMRKAVSAKQFRYLCVLVMLSPTLIFWPSSIGKESLSLLGIGLATHGAALLYDRQRTGALPVMAGAFAVGMVRPHVALIVLAAIATGILARRAHTRGRLLSHVIVLLIAIVGAMVLASASATLFGLESVADVSDLSAALDFAQERTSKDTSQFVAARVSNPTEYPWAVVTVLFRPFVWEASNSAAMLSAAEGAVLASLLIWALPGILRDPKHFIQRGQLLYVVAFSSVFVFLFSAIGNFGILSRQRAQVMPFVLVFVAFGLAAEKRQIGRKQ